MNKFLLTETPLSHSLCGWEKEDDSNRRRIRTKQTTAPSPLLFSLARFILKNQELTIYYRYSKSGLGFDAGGKRKKKRTLSERKFYLSDLLFQFLFVFFLSYTYEIFKKSYDAGTLSFGPTLNTKSFFFPSYSKHGAPPKSITR